MKKPAGTSQAGKEKPGAMSGLINQSVSLWHYGAFHINPTSFATVSVMPLCPASSF
jgi:hypothetical protein